MLLLLLAALPSDYLPCTPGLSIEYAFEKATITDTIEGRDARNHCRIERVDSRGSEVYLREILKDRVLAAGFASTPLAQRPPLLVGPIEVGTKWQFNRARYRIVEVGPCRAGTLSFDRCVTVEIGGDDGSKNRSTYAEGIGLVIQTFGDKTMIATRVRESKSARKSPREARD